MENTAIEWLFDKLWNEPKDKLTWHSILKKAKQREEKDHQQTYMAGGKAGAAAMNGRPNFLTFEEYWKSEGDKNYSQYVLDDERKVITHMGIDYTLEKKSFSIAKFLYEHKNIVVDRDKLYNAIWGDVIIDVRGLDVHIRKIRRGVPGIPIQTRKGLGHMWVE